MRPSARAAPDPTANPRSPADAANPVDPAFALGTQGALIAELLGLARAADAQAQPHLIELIDRVASLNRELTERMTNGCAELQSVGAGLDSVLQLAELQSEKTEEAYGLYCLLRLLKLQLDTAVEDVRRML